MVPSAESVMRHASPGGLHWRAVSRDRQKAREAARDVEARQIVGECANFRGFVRLLPSAIHAVGSAIATIS